MKFIYKYTIGFFLIYIVISVLSIPLTFAWTAFGGWNSMNVVQKGVFYFLDFPSSYFQVYNVFFTVLINAVFWSVIFFLIILTINKIRNEKTAN